MSGINYQIWNKHKQEVQEDYNREHPKNWSVHKVKTKKGILGRKTPIPNPLIFRGSLNLKNNKEHYFDLDYTQEGMQYE